MLIKRKPKIALTYRLRVLTRISQLLVRDGKCFRFVTELIRLTWSGLRRWVPDIDASKASSFNEQLVVMKHAGLCVQLLAQQLTVVGGPVEHIARLMVRKTRHVNEVAARRVITNDERVRAVECRRHYDSTAATTSKAGTPATVASDGIEQSVVGVVDDK